MIRFDFRHGRCRGCGNEVMLTGLTDRSMNNGDSEMEELLQGVGIFVFVVLAIIGLVAGWLAGLVAGKHKGRFAILGLVGAVLAPFVLALLGLGALAAGGIAAVIIVGLVGAALLLMIGKMIFD